MKKLTIATLALAAYAGCMYAEPYTGDITWCDSETRATAITPAPVDVNIILEDQLPEGGIKKLYMADFNYAYISMYGVTWAHDDNMAMYIYWTDSDVAYVKNLSTLSDAWVMAYVDGDTLWVPNGQDVMMSKGGTLYQLITGTVNMKNNEFEMRTGIKFNMNADRTELEMEPSPDRENVLGFFSMDVEGGKISQAYSKITLTEFTAQPILPPDDAEFKRYTYSALLGGALEWTNRSWLAFDGEDVYIQGLEWTCPDRWVKGSLMSDDSIRIPSEQYVDMNGNYPVYYFGGLWEGDFLEDNVKITDRSAFFLNYDDNTGAYSMVDNECFVAGKDRSYGFPVIAGKFVPLDIQPGTPCAAEDLEWDQELKLLKFHIPMTDTEGNGLDYYLLKYSIYVNGEKHMFTSSNSPLYNEEKDTLTGDEIHYFHDIDTGYMFGRNEGDVYVVSVNTTEPLKSLGVSLTYDVLGDARSSEMSSIEVSSIPMVDNPDKLPVAYFSIDGRKLTAPSGIYMVRYSDGTVEKKFSHR